jgi:hypothetical protein
VLLVLVLHVSLGVLSIEALTAELLDLVATEVGPRRARLAVELDTCCSCTCCCTGIVG